MLRHQPNKGRRVNAAQRHQLPENIGDQRDRAADNKDAAQLADIAVHIADDARHAAVEAKRGENDRDRGKRQPFFQRQRQQVDLVHVRGQQHQHDNQEENFGAEQKAVKQIDQRCPHADHAAADERKEDSPRRRGNVRAKPVVDAGGDEFPAPLI